MKKFKKTEAFKKYANTAPGNGQMVRPLTLAMTVNIIVIIAVIFIPGIWKYSEFLFPITITALLLIGIDASMLFTKHMGRIVTHGDIEFVNGNNLSQVLASFAFAMIAVGFSAPMIINSSTTRCDKKILWKIFIIHICALNLYFNLYKLIIYGKA